MIPLRTSTFSRPAAAMFSPARAIISSVMSTPITRPAGPTLRARAGGRCRARSQIEDHLPGLDLGVGEGVAAAEGVHHRVGRSAASSSSEYPASLAATPFCTGPLQQPWPGDCTARA